MRPLLLFLSLLLQACFSYKILIVSPKYGWSHMVFMGNIADTLVDAGHDVTVLQPLIATYINGSGTSKAKLVEVATIAEVTRYMHEVEIPSCADVWLTGAKNPVSLLSAATPMSVLQGMQCGVTIRDTATLDRLRTENFDIAITEQFDFCGFGLIHLLGINNTLAASSTVVWDTMAWAFGAPLATSYVPGSMSVVGDDMGVGDKMRNAIGTLFSFYLFGITEARAHEQFVQVHGPHFPKLTDLMTRSSLVLTNSIPLLDFPRPTLHKFVDIGGISVKPTTKLDDRFDGLLSLRPRTVLLSFGTVAQSVDMPRPFRHNLVQVLKSFPDVTFIWKYEDPADDFARAAENIIITEWMPQSNLLGDPRLAAFITHGGMGSVTEAAVRGKPILTIPLFGDQGRNAAVAKKRGFGIVYDKDALGDREQLTAAIQRLLTDETLASAARRISSMVAQQPVSAKEALLKHIEFVGQFGPYDNLDPLGRHMSLISYYLIDVLAIIISAVSLILVASFIAVRWVFRQFTKKPHEKMN